MLKRDKVKEEAPVDIPEEIPEPIAREWAENFDSVDHNHFLRMSAEAMQEAMNIASKSGNVEHLLSVANHWGTLAVSVRDMSKGRSVVGFNREEDVDG